MENSIDKSAKLKAKIKNKKSQRTNKDNENISISGETDILKMMEHVNKLLKTNPDLVKQVSKCVSNVMNDKTLLDTITGKLQDQTLDKSDETEEPIALSKESLQ
jgi:hypothetical protein